MGESDAIKELRGNYKRRANELAEARTAAALERVDRLLRRVREAKREGRAAARPKRKAGAA